MLGGINLELWMGRSYRRSVAQIRPPYQSSQPERVALSCEHGDFATPWYPLDLEGIAVSEIRIHQFTGCAAGRPA